MTERSRQGQALAAAQPIRIPRIAIAPPSAQLTGSNYMSPHASTLPRRNDILTSPTYIADHLPSRRLSEIDSPFYLPTLLSSTAERAPRSPPPISGYSTAPLRIRTDVTAHPRFVDTATDHNYGTGTREYSRDRTVTSADNHADFIRFSDYPATSAVIGLQPPRIMTPTSSPEAIELKDSNQLVAETSEDVDRLALFNNSSLGYQRVCYLLSRYPAVAMTIIGTWMLWGRGLGLNSKDSNENICYIVSFAAGVFILCSQVLLAGSHNNSYKKEKVLANLYHFSNTIGVLISTTVIVFASISFQKVKKVTAGGDTCTWQDPQMWTTSCFTPNERQIFLSILIGASSLVILLYFFSGIYGCVGQALMKKKRQTEYRQYAEAHDNAAFRF